ncbi:MAG: carbohydrate kinase family protein [Turicibacter sp.]|nr:carbohydrate kinase family protein [Turicibacter sp.]
MKEQLQDLITALNGKKGYDLKMVIGLDGFVDEIVHLVDKRTDFENFTRIPTIANLGERISRAAGLSTNIEMVPIQLKLGGNGPILSNALLNYGVKLTYIGALGEPHPVFADMAERSEKVYSLCNPAHTHALEFEDGKVMMGKLNSLNQITWARFKEVVGSADEIAKIFNSSNLIGMENWVMIPHMSQIWRGIIEEVFPLMGATKPLAFFDLCDPEKRTPEDISEAMTLIGKFEEKFRTILGLNESELYRIAAVFGLKNEGLQATTIALAKKLNIYGLVIHPVKEACCVIDNQYFHVDGPYCEKPLLTTGAGDNFNSGFCLAQSLELSPQQSLTLGVCTSGFYVRNAKSPTYSEVLQFAQKWQNGEI